MTDVLTAEQRHKNMSRIRSRDTAPEKKLRSLLFQRGYRFRLCDRRLPGTPDIVLKKYRTVIFVHGCFWHRHAGCRYATTPSSNKKFWEEKFLKNVERDHRNTAELLALGWNVVIVWECHLKHNSSAVIELLLQLLQCSQDLSPCAIYDLTLTDIDTDSLQTKED